MRGSVPELFSRVESAVGNMDPCVFQYVSKSFTCTSKRRFIVLSIELVVCVSAHKHAFDSCIHVCVVVGMLL